MLPEADVLARSSNRSTQNGKARPALLCERQSVGHTDRFRPEEQVVVLGNTEWKPALLGLAANSVVEERAASCACGGRDALGRLKARAAQDGSFSVVELFSNTKDAVVEFGGHERSGGFSVSHERVHELQNALATASLSLTNASVISSGPQYDARITLAEISRGLFNDISRLSRIRSRYSWSSARPLRR